jgi:glycosyltransferase involved in cell wall biosynthesis
VISVVIATHNRERFLISAIDSILGQTLQDFELLIVDDASTDGTATFLAKRARTDKRIKILRTSTNSGCNVARNVAFLHVRGRYVALLDDDDLAMPQRLEKTVAKLEAEPDLGVVCTQYRFIDGNGRLRSWIPKFISIDDIPTPGAGCVRSPLLRLGVHSYKHVEFQN